MTRTINARLRDELIAHRVYLTRYESGVVAELLSTLSADDAELAARLLTIIEDLPAGNISVKMLERVLQPVRVINRQAVTRFFTQLGGVLKDFMEYEAGYSVDLIKSLLPPAVTRRGLLNRLDAGAAYTQTVSEPFHGYTLKEWTDKLEADRFARIINTVRAGRGCGDAPEQIARDVRGTKAKGYKDGALQKSRSNASAIGYSALAHASGGILDRVSVANQHLVKAKQWLSTLDNKTSPPCRIRDALLYTLTGEPINHAIPWGDGPGRLHFHCRSTYTFIFKNWQEMGLLADELTAEEKDDLTGEIPKEITYPEWIKRQRVSRQNDILGPTRAKLLRDGGLTLTQFYTEDGRYLTLEQLKQRDANAFKRAGIRQ